MIEMTKGKCYLILGVTQMKNYFVSMRHFSRVKHTFLVSVVLLRVTRYPEMFRCFSNVSVCPDYSELPPSVSSNGPHEVDCEEEEENGYDIPKPPLPIARRTLSEASSSSAAFSRLSVDSEPGTSASKYSLTDQIRSAQLITPRIYCITLI